MITPVSYRPKITQQDINRGAISRYFVQYVSGRSVIEVDENQYNIFKNNPYYVTVKMPWVLTGNLHTSGSVLSVEEQNQRILNYYSQTLPGLRKQVRSAGEYTSPTINTRPQVTVVPVPPAPYQEVIAPTVEPPATIIITTPSQLTFSYIIGGSVPTSQNVSITSDGTLGNIFIQSSSSWVTASLAATTAPTTVEVTPSITGLYSGSYNSILTVDSTQDGIPPTYVGITLNVTNNPEILFIYEPGMPLDTATFTRPTSASFNELVP